MVSRIIRIALNYWTMKLMLLGIQEQSSPISGKIP